jgi:hypothetical protein
MMFKVGSGENIFLWLDNWHPDGVLLDRYGPRIIYEAGSHLNAKLATVIQEKNWYWQAAKSENLVKIQSKLPLVSIDEEDQPIWSISKSGVFNCADSWNAIRTKYLPATWWKLVWFPEAIPKQVFKTWLVACDNLSTGERLLKLGFVGDVLCGFL